MYIVHCTLVQQQYIRVQYVHVLGILVAVFNDVYDFAIEISSNRVFLFLYFLKQLSPEPYKTIV